MNFKIATVLVALSSFIYGAGFIDMGMKDNIHIMLSSQKVLSVGENRITIELNEGGHGGNQIKASDVRIKFFMPEMPGMPYMESKDICKNSDNRYRCNINFSMEGTWQYQLFITVSEDTKLKYRGSVNLGQTSEHHMHY